jgi:hypothetical protein
MSILRESAAGFHALRTRPAPVGDAVFGLTVHALGILRVPSGRLEASDPFVNLGESGEAVVTDVPPGDYPVVLTVADTSDEQDGSEPREAYLSVVVAAGEAVTVGPALPPGVDEDLLTEDVYTGVPVEAGTVAFADADSVIACMPPDQGSWYSFVFDTGEPGSWFARMDDPAHLRAGAANIVFPFAVNGENLVLAHSGWGDGYYSVMKSYAADGSLLGVHIDLDVVGGDGEDDADDGDVAANQGVSPRLAWTSGPDGGVVSAAPGLTRRIRRLFGR